MRYMIVTQCEAIVAESWYVEIPDDTPEDEVESALMDALGNAGTEFIHESVVEDTERDRELRVWGRA
jgi:hypothetical protein